MITFCLFSYICKSPLKSITLFAVNKNQCFKGNSLFLLIVLGLIFLNSNAHGQERYLFGHIIDRKSDSPVVGASIVELSSGLGTISDSIGFFQLKISKFPLLVEISHLSYRSDSLYFKNENAWMEMVGNKELKISLVPSTIMIESVSVIAGVERLFDREPFGIMDFEIKGDKIYSLALKNNNPIKTHLALSNLSGGILTTLRVSKLEEVYMDMEESLFAICKDSVFPIDSQNDRLFLKSGMPRKTFEDEIRPICYSDDSNILFSQSTENKFKINFYNYSFVQNQTQLFYSAGDSIDERRYERANRIVRDNYAKIVKIRAVEPGMTTGMWGKTALLLAYNNSAFSQEFRKLIDLKQPKIELIPFKDSVFIFNFDSLTLHNYFPAEYQTIVYGIHHLVSPTFDYKILKDRATNRCYLVYLENQITSIRELNTNTLKLNRQIQFRGFRNIHNLQIYNNKAYFLYLPIIGERIQKVYSRKI